MMTMKACIPLPAEKAKWAGPKLVHQDPQRQSGRAQQEGANCEAQIQHLFLIHAARPITTLPGAHVADDRLVVWEAVRGAEDVREKGS